MESKSTGGSSGVLLWIGGSLLGTYFVCPILYLLPLIAIYGKGASPPASIQSGVQVFFAPITYLNQTLPFYRDWLTLQGKVFGFE